MARRQLKIIQQRLRAERTKPRITMKRKLNIRKTALIALCALAFGPALLFAGNAPKRAKERGIIKSVDNNTHQVIVTDQKTKLDGTFQWNDQTKFTEHGKAMTAADLKAGEHVRLSYTPGSGTPTLQHISLWPEQYQYQKHASASLSSHRKP